MAWHDQDSWLTAAFAPKLSTIAFTLLVALLLPILAHQLLYRKRATTQLPKFLLVGPSGGGKTALLSLVERKTVAPTHTSTSPLAVESVLPEDFVPCTAHYRSPGDPSYERARHFLILDTPGHGKLRHFATSQLGGPASNSIRGIIFVVDAASLAEEGGLNEAAEYLHHVLLALQKRYTGAKTSKGPKEIPVLVAANKLDLFTALPPHLVKLGLERAITEVRKSRAVGLKDSGKVLGGEGDEGVDEDEEREWLGEGGEGAFEFGQMDECGTVVKVLGGNVLGAEGVDVQGWWEWIAEQL